MLHTQICDSSAGWKDWLPAMFNLNIGTNCSGVSKGSAPSTRIALAINCKWLGILQGEASGIQRGNQDNFPLSASPMVQELRQCKSVFVQILTFCFSSVFSSVSCSTFCRNSVTSSFRASTSADSGPLAPRCCFRKLQIWSRNTDCILGRKAGKYMGVPMTTILPRFPKLRSIEDRYNQVKTFSSSWVFFLHTVRNKQTVIKTFVPGGC